MPESKTTSPPTANGEPKESPLDRLCRRWARNSDWRDKLAKRVSYQALDIPEDDMDIKGGDRNVTHNGIGAKGLIGIAAAIGVPAWIALAVLAYSLFNKPDPPPVQHPPDIDTQYRIKPKPGGSE